LRDRRGRLRPKSYRGATIRQQSGYFYNDHHHCSWSRYCLDSGDDYQHFDLRHAERG